MQNSWILGLAAGISGFLLLNGPSALANSVQPETAEPSSTLAQGDSLPDIWQEASDEEISQIWRYVLHSPLGIAALNQLAIEGFISPTCEKTWYKHAEFDTFQTLLQVDCGVPQGISTARAYDEMRVTFNRFEDTISDFEIERMYVDE
jgi:hypothetical protein